MCKFLKITQCPLVSDCRNTYPTAGNLAQTLHWNKAHFAQFWDSSTVWGSPILENLVYSAKTKYWENKSHIWESSIYPVPNIWNAKIALYSQNFNIGNTADYSTILKTVLF